MKFLRKASALTNTWVEHSLALMGITMACVVALQVFCRYILNSSLFWSEELARYLLVWLTFLGASSAYYRKVHPSIDLLTCRIRGVSKKILRITVHLFSLMLFAVMIYHGIFFAHFIRAQITPALGLPKWLIFSIIPLSGLLFLLHCLVFLVTDLQEDENDQ